MSKPKKIVRKKVCKKEPVPKKKKALKRKSNVIDSETDSEVPPDPEIQALIATIGEEKRKELEEKFQFGLALESVQEVSIDERRVGDDIEAQKKSGNDSSHFKVIKNLNKHINGLIKNTNYYMTSKNPFLPVSYYKTEQSLSSKTFYLMAKEFRTLKSPLLINSVVLDCFIAAHIDEWDDYTFVSLDDTAKMIGNHREKKFRNRKICQIDKPLKKNIIMIYLFEAHYRTIICNIELEQLIFYDPYEVATDKDEAVKYFQSFVKTAKRTHHSIN